MDLRTSVVGFVIVLTLSASGDIFACGDKFLVGGRGTRYQRPKDARAASILIYADVSSGLTTGGRSARLESALKRHGHRPATAVSLEQLSAVLSSGRFDVVLATSSAAGSVERLLTGTPDPAIVLAVDAQPKGRSLLDAIDRAVEARDKNLKKLIARS